MDTPGDVASGLLYGRVVWSGSAAGDKGSVDGMVQALVRVGLLSPEEGGVWRASLVDAASAQRRARRVLRGRERFPSAVNARCREEAARVLDELLDTVPAREGRKELVARNRFEGALDALAEIGAVEREDWDARVRERSPSARRMWEAWEEFIDPDRPVTPIGTEQETVGGYCWLFGVVGGLAGVVWAAVRGRGQLRVLA
jgi:hypothetical protein